MKNILISFVGIFLLTSLNSKVFAQEKNQVTIIIDQNNSEVIIINKNDRIVFPAITGLQNRKLDLGIYKVKYMPTCIKKPNGYCLLGADKLYHPNPDQIISRLNAWGSNKVVSLPIFFESIQITKKFGNKVTGVKKGFEPISAIHSDVHSEGETPPEMIKQGKASQGCIRIGWYNLKYLYTLILAQERNENVVIYVK
ncbi:MAG: L,D-transpeptidase family protein [candidate division SR1 bacterium]|nr:L,D-transpeptidase family protein [candidate division SR1 bacterium]